MHEMGHEIREKHSGEETSDVVMPIHCEFECNPSFTKCALLCEL